LGDDDVGENSGDVALSTDLRGAGEDIALLSRPRRPLKGSSAVSITSTSGHRGIIASGEWDERQTSWVAIWNDQICGRGLKD
jgi:hypothetical protein